MKHFLRDINSAAILGSPVFIALVSSLSGFYGPPWASAPTNPNRDRGNHGLFSRNHYGEKTDLRPSDYVGTRCNFVDAICVFVGDDPASDVTGALNATMEVVWLDRFPYDGRYDGNKKVHRVKSVKEYFDL